MLLQSGCYRFVHLFNNVIKCIFYLLFCLYVFVNKYVILDKFLH